MKLKKLKSWLKAARQYKCFFCPHPYFIMWGKTQFSGGQKFLGLYKENKNKYGCNIGCGYLKIFEFKY